MTQKGSKIVNDGAGVAVVPSGVMVISFTEGVSGMRWSVSSDKNDEARVLCTLRGMVDCFQEYQTSDAHNGLLHYLESA